MLLDKLQLAASLCMTVGIFIPFFRRLLKRKHSRDYSKTSNWFIFLVQVNQLGLALHQHSEYFIVWYVVQSSLCALQLYLIYYYWNHDEPRYRQAQ